MVKVKNGQIQAINMALAELLRLRVGVGTGLKLRKLARQLEQQSGDVEAERKRLLEMFAKKDEAGEWVFQDKEAGVVAVEPGFDAEWRTLMDLEFEAVPIRASELEKAGPVMSVTLLQLGELIVEDLE